MKWPKASVFGCALLSLLLLTGRADADSEGDDGNNNGNKGDDYLDYVMEQQARADKLLAEWRAAGSPGEGKAHEELRKQLIEAAVHADNAGIVDEVAAGGDVAAREIKLLRDARRVEAHELFRFGGLPEGPYSGKAPWVIRRMTKTRIEVWTPRRGWLFDESGKLVGTATPPRRDGMGREWYGAFLPDGRWVTTDLWDFDKTLHFFSKKGKMLKGMSAKQLAPPISEDRERFGTDIIAWARCDREGKGWVVSIGSEGGRAVVFVTPEGKVRRTGIDPWSLCFPRDVEPKGYYIALSIPSDDGKDILSREVPGHGAWVGYPTFDWNRSQPQSKVIAEGENPFGFLPGSHDVFIGASQRGPWPPEEVAATSADAQSFPKTWFFGSDGKCRGWVKGTWLTDSAGPADSRAGVLYWLRDNENAVVTLDSALKPTSRERYEIGGIAAIPMKLFTDLRLGLFVVKGELVLAKW